MEDFESPLMTASKRFLTLKLLHNCNCYQLSQCEMPFNTQQIQLISVEEKNRQKKIVNKISSENDYIVMRFDHFSRSNLSRHLTVLIFCFFLLIQTYFYHLFSSSIYLFPFLKSLSMSISLPPFSGLEYLKLKTTLSCVIITNSIKSKQIESNKQTNTPAHHINQSIFGASHDFQINHIRA